MQTFSSDENMQLSSLSVGILLEIYFVMPVGKLQLLKHNNLVSVVGSIPVLFHVCDRLYFVKPELWS